MLKKRGSTNKSKNREGRVQRMCSLRSPMLQLAWFPDVAYLSFKLKSIHPSFTLKLRLKVQKSLFLSNLISHLIPQNLKSPSSLKALKLVSVAADLCLCVYRKEICNSGASYLMCPLCNTCKAWNMSDICTMAKVRSIISTDQMRPSKLIGFF